MGNLAKGSPLIKKLIFFVSYLTRAECHHAGSATAAQVLQKVNARYVYGVTATPKRGDNLEKIVHMLLGPIRHSYNAKERAMEQGIGHMYIRDIQG